MAGRKPPRDESLPLVQETGAEVEEGGLTRWIYLIKSMLACVVYLAVGPALILINRHILKEVGFNFPMALSGLGLVGASLTATVLIKVVRLVEPQHRHLVTPQFMLYNLAPIGATMAGTLACGNAVYLYLPVGFIQMLKAFTPTVTLLMLFLLQIERPSALVSMTVIGMCAGTAAATVGTTDFNLVGLLIMLSSETCEALRLVLTQKLLQNNNFGVVEGQYYMAPVSFMWLISASAILELPRAIQSGAWRAPLNHPGPFLLSLALGAVVNYCAAAVIKLTNSVTLKVLSTARNASLVLVSSMVLGEHITQLEMVGYTISLISFGLYNYFRIRKL